MATANQLRYHELQELKRSNIAKETENTRSNVARETETTRHNLANEVETASHNRSQEGYWTEQLKNDRKIANAKRRESWVKAFKAVTDLLPTTTVTESFSVG